MTTVAFLMEKKLRLTDSVASDLYLMNGSSSLFVSIGSHFEYC
ncbi:hypothetical protein FTV88_2486 [Heliorestis convoluta]|uniref:Uncharacterized protein n=1 Tax=Heliorestis convoluta TaxID=356322 RepID=A0A5Q2N3W6_9FIRM|nr:hypothetical protein FTV88_2486 [Heliorestis convoluta]